MQRLKNRWQERSVSKALWLWLSMLGLIMLILWLVNAEGELVGRLLLWQRELHRGLSMAVTQLSSTPSVATWATLITASFGYGVFHAAGPGHGKAVLSTYLLSQGGSIGRALLLSISASLLQAIVAIALVVALVHGLGWLTREAMESVAWVEQASFAMVILLGLWLCLRALRLMCAAYRSNQRAPGTQHVHGGCGCGHEHHVDPAQTENWRTALVTVAAIGMRPCSGGVLVLGAASLLGQFWAGVVAVIAMAAGTALAISGLALISVMARDWAEHHLTTNRFSGFSGKYLLSGIALTGGIIIVTLGVSLSVASVANGGASLLTPSAETERAPRSPFNR